MAGQHLEIERKYSVPDGAPPPSGLGEVADVRELELVAEYLDTEDLALAARGTSLRRRTGGDDDGWHLKTTEGPDRRRELRAPPGAPQDGVPTSSSTPSGPSCATGRWSGSRWCATAGWSTASSTTRARTWPRCATTT